jgi:uncharacterized Zn finger protein
VDALIALHTKDLSAAHRYLHLAELCRQHGRDADALRWAEEGVWQFEKNPDERLVVFTARLYRRAGRRADAAELLWRCFERRPSLELFAELKKSGDNGAADAPAERAIALLKSRLAAKPRRSAADSFFLDASPDLLIRVLMREKKLAEAWEIAHKQTCFAPTLNDLAEASEEQHPAEAIKAYARLVESAVARTNEQAYQEAGRLIKRIGAIRHRLGDADAQSAYVEDLARRHKAKRNFIKLLRR